MRTVVAFVLAVAATWLVGVTAASQLVLGNLVEMGLSVPMDVRLSATLHDLGSMGMTYVPIVTIAFLVAFSLARLFAKFVPHLRSLAYVAAGFAALWGIDFLLSLPFNTHMLPVTRTGIGLISQCIAGAIGGFVFVTVVTPPTPQPTKYPA